MVPTSGPVSSRSAICSLPSLGRAGWYPNRTSMTAVGPRGRRDAQSCKTTLRSKLLTLHAGVEVAVVSKKPNRLNLFMKKFTRNRVVPPISESDVNAMAEGDHASQTDPCMKERATVRVVRCAMEGDVVVHAWSVVRF